MPEGPEVKIASQYFNSFFKNSNYLEFQIISEYYKLKYDEVFKIINNKIKTFEPIYTIGKQLFMKLDNNLLFNFHLGMTGGWSNTLIKHCHFKVHNNSKELFFRDIRKFGKMRIVNNQEIEKKHHKEFDSLNKEYDYDYHLKYLNNNIKDSKSICSILMNQLYFPGVGNYIKSESLYAAKIHPELKWGQLSIKKKKDLILIVKDVMLSSYKSGGAELRDFKNPFHKSKFKLHVYGKKKINNKLIISKITSDQRKTWFCPDIQKKY